MRRCAILGWLLTLLAGCAGGPSNPLAMNYSGSLLADLGNSNDPATVARLQSPESSEVKFRAPPPATPVSRQFPAPPSTGLASGVPMPPSAPNNYKINVRAWVNGRPLYDDEVFQGLTPDQARHIGGLPESQRVEELTKFVNKQVESLIDQEVLYQDAVTKLEKMNPRALDKLRDHANKEFEKQMKRIRETAKVPEEQLRDLSRLLQRKTEREFIASEYMRSRIFPRIVSAIGPPEVREYYEKHLNEFQKVERVKWQDVFIAVGPKHPTIEQARQYAQSLIDRCRTVEDFEQLIQLDEGDSKLRGGEGYGSRRGEIKPPECEEHLFKLRDGEIGPVVVLTTGVHIIRLVKREEGGQIPLNQEVQLQIRNKLRSEVADRELKRLLKELRSRAVIEIDAES